LDLSNNEISEQLPHSLGMCQNLTNLNVSHNDLIGPLPDGIGGAIALRTIHLQNNRLSGAIPPSFGKLANLEVRAAQLDALVGRITLLACHVSGLRFVFQPFYWRASHYNRWLRFIARFPPGMSDLRPDLVDKLCCDKTDLVFWFVAGEQQFAWAIAI
jgi:hypothetical protein